MMPTSFTLICHMHLVACICAVLYNIRLQLELWWLGSPREAVKYLLLHFRKHPPQEIKSFHSWFCMRNRPTFVAIISAVVRSVEVAKVASNVQGYWPVTTTKDFKVLPPCTCWDVIARRVRTGARVSALTVPRRPAPVFKFECRHTASQDFTLLMPRLDAHH